MDIGWALTGAAMGAIAGAALRHVVFRHSVPHGDAPRTACPACGQSVRGRVLLVRCGRCGASLGTPFALEVSSAVVLALVLGSFAGRWEAAAFGFLGLLGVALAAIDIAVRRLPHRLTMPAYPMVLILLGGAAVAGGEPAALWRALLGGAALAASYYLLALLRPGDMGGGDIALAGLLGVALGWLGWPILAMGAFLAFALFGIVTVGLLVARRITLRSHLAFGPFMLGGALLAAIAF